MTTLTAEDAENMRNWYDLDVYSVAELSELYGVRCCIVKKVLLKQLWRPVGLLKSKTGGWRARALLPRLGRCERCGAKAVDRHHRNGNSFDNQRGNIAELCRRCHMIEDGRLTRFQLNGRLASIKARTPARRCLCCRRLAKPLRHARCHRCSTYFKRTGREWSAAGVASKPKPPSRPHCVMRYAQPWLLPSRT